MKKSIRWGTVSGLYLAACLTFLPCLGSIYGQEATVKTENGIPVIYNPKKPAPPPGGPSSLILTHDLTVGRETGDENEMFAWIRSIQVDDEGNIYILDSREFRIKAYDKNGMFLRTFGKKGKGPGEMEISVRMEMAPGGRLVVADAGNAKLIFFSFKGACLKEISLGQHQFMRRLKFNSQGAIYAETGTFDSGKSIIELIKFSPDIKPLATLTRVEDKHMPPNFAAFSPALFFEMTRKNDLIWMVGETEKYEFTIMDAEGKTTKRIVKDYKPVGITAAQKEKLIRDAFGEKGIPSDATFEIPSRFPAVSRFFTDDEDRIFACTYALEGKDGEPRTSYDVFDSGGRCFAGFSLPEREWAVLSRKGKLYCIVPENEDGIPQIKRYAMTWK